MCDNNEIPIGWDYIFSKNSSLSSGVKIAKLMLKSRVNDSKSEKVLI
jgi:hypothetical protein